MGMAAVRKELGSALKAELGKDWAVFPNFENTDEPTKKTLLLNRSSVTRDSTAMGFYSNTFTLFLLMPANTDADQLDDALDELLEVLDEKVQTRWTDARRGVNENNYPAYEITLTALSQRK